MTILTSCSTAQIVATATMHGPNLKARCSGRCPGTLAVCPNRWRRIHRRPSRDGSSATCWQLREGRNVAQLGGPVIPSQCSALQLVLNNFDGYYTFGAGMALGPGSRRCVCSGRPSPRMPGLHGLSAAYRTLATGTDANPIMITRWVGALYRFTSGRIPGRLIINQTPQSRL